MLVCLEIYSFNTYLVLYRRGEERREGGGGGGGGGSDGDDVIGVSGCASGKHTGERQTTMTNALNPTNYKRKLVE